ncbi:MAG: hypothetical protein VX899_08555 [Myxococcota bacterium]|nr:hypothetical protein [Myxococcota bacterium]
MNTLFLLLLTATGLPPMPLVTEVSERCPGEGSPRITYEIQSGVCAPGGPCSYSTQQGDPNTDLPLTQQGCFWPEAGHWVRDGSCGGAPLWAWRGRTPQGSFTMGPLHVEKSPPKRCPGPPPGARSSAPFSNPDELGQWMSMGLDMVKLLPAADGKVRVAFPLPGHALDDPEATYLSEPLQKEEADQLLQATTQTHYGGRKAISYRATVPTNEVTLVSFEQGNRTRCAQVQELVYRAELPSGLVLTASGQRHSWMRDQDCPRS